MLDEHLDDIFLYSQELLECIVQVYAESGVSLPEKRYTTVGGIGTTPHDCEQLTISWEQAYSGLPGDQSQELVACDGPVTSVFVVELVRCIPSDLNVVKRGARSTSATLTPEVPTETREQTSKTQMRDAYLLRTAGMNSSESPLIAHNGALVDASAGQPQGAYQAIIMTIAVGV